MTSIKIEEPRFQNPMEDSCLGIDVPDDPSTLKLKQLRDKITFKEKEKLLHQNFIESVNFNGGKSEVALSCEISCLISTLNRQNLLKNETLKGLESLMTKILRYISTFKYPFTRHDISILRSFKVISKALNFVPIGTMECFLELLFLKNDTPCVYAFKNEIISFLTNTATPHDLNHKNIFYVLNNPNLNAIELLDKLISPFNYHWIKINSIASRLNLYNAQKKTHALELCVKWYALAEGRHKKTIVDLLTKRAPIDQTSLLYLGRVLEGSLEAQEYATSKGIVTLICTRYKNTVTLAVVSALTALVESLEINRKAVGDSQILQSILSTFMQLCLSQTHKSLFYAIINFLKAMTRSVLFLRTTLLDYPIIELLFTSLDQPTCEPKSILSLLTNLVFEFGTYKNKFVACGGFERVLKFKKDFPVEVLAILKNFLYDTQWEAKEEFLRATDEDFLNYFFGVYEESRDLVLLGTLFNLIRNLVCEDSLELVLASFPGLVPQVFRHLRVCVREGGPEGSGDGPTHDVLIHILYTISNLSANSPSFRDLLFIEDRLDDLKRACVTRDLQLAFVWIVINLSWKDEGYEGRVNKLKAAGVKQFLLGMTVGDSELLDKINTALDNLK